MKITYTRVGDYYLPNLAAPESPKVGRWGMLRFNYLYSLNPPDSGTASTCR